MSRIRAVVVGLALAAVVACGGPSPDGSVRESTRSPGQAAPPAAAAAGRALDASAAGAEDTVPAQAITWDAAAVEAALGAAGLQPARAAEQVRQPFMRVPGIVYTVRGGGELQVYLYADANAAAPDAEQLDTARVAPRTTMVTWRATPALVTSNNLVAIVLSNDADVRRRVREALTARQPHRSR